MGVVAKRVQSSLVNRDTKATEPNVRYTDIQVRTLLPRKPAKEKVYIRRISTQNPRLVSLPA